jgi:hypothetical protein
MPTTLQFTGASYSVNEAGGLINIAVTRSGDASSAARVGYTASNATAKQGTDYIASQGFLDFGAGETSKSFPVLIIDNAFVDGPRTVNLTLDNPSGATLGAQTSATLTISDNDLILGVNPLDVPRTFVQSNYYDFLGRYPDPSGWDFWTGQITACGTDIACAEVARINTSGAFFLSIEFQQTGYLVERMYKTAYGSATGNSTLGGGRQLSVPMVRFDEFLRDTQRIGQGVVVLAPGWEQLLGSNKQKYASEFVQTLRFMGAFPYDGSGGICRQTESECGQCFIVDGTDSDNQLFAGAADSSDLTARAQAVRQLPRMQPTQRKESRVCTAEYFGYLRRIRIRDGDYTGYDFWLTKLNEFTGNYIAAEMVKAFISSDEYRHLLGP